MLATRIQTRWRSRMLAAAIAACAAVAGCGDSAEEKMLVLRFEHRIGDDRVALGTTYTTRYGQDVSFHHIRYWVSNVSLHRSGGSGAPTPESEDWYHVPASYYLVEQAPWRTRLSVAIGDIPPGQYDALALHIGVDPGPNGSLDLLAGELEPGIEMDWSWDTGYKFFRTEGSFAEGGVEGQFAIHTGNDVLYKRLFAELSQPIELRVGATTEVALVAELDRVFAGVELRRTSQIFGGTVDSVAGKIAGNYSRMFTAVTPAEGVRMGATSPNLQAGPGDDEGEIPTDSTPPVLTEAPIDFATALWCSEVPGRPAEAERACMTPFVLGDGTAYQDAGYLSFVTANGAPVRASAPGVVADVVFLDHSLLTHADLFLVAIRPNDDSAFFLEYRNLKDLEVEEGDTIEAGQVLGTAGDYYDPSVGTVSFGVRRKQELVQRLCPTRYATEELGGRYADALAMSNQAWPSFAQDALCQAPSLICTGESCDTSKDFVLAQGDADAGRRIFASACASCHGTAGEGGIAAPLCSGPGCPCLDCVDHGTLAARIEADMPPEGYCDAECAANVAAFILHAFARE